MEKTSTVHKFGDLTVEVPKCFYQLIGLLYTNSITLCNSIIVIFLFCYTFFKIYYNLSVDKSSFFTEIQNVKEFFYVPKHQKLYGEYDIFTDTTRFIRTTL